MGIYSHSQIMCSVQTLMTYSQHFYLFYELSIIMHCKTKCSYSIICCYLKKNYIQQKYVLLKLFSRTIFW